MKNHLEIQFLRVDELKPPRRSLRNHNRKNLNMLRASMEQSGMVIPIIVDENNYIIDGHARWVVAKVLGIKVVPTICLANRTEAEKIALQMALNRLVELAAWDIPAMKAGFELLIEVGYDTTLTGFEPAQIDDIMVFDGPASGEVETLDASGLANTKPPIAQPGDIWICGDHRLACGDFRDEALQGRLFAGDSAQLCLSDLPYNVPIAGNVSGLGKVKHSEFAMASGEMSEAEFTVFLGRFFRSVLNHITAGGLIYAFMDWRSIALLIGSGKAAGLSLLNLVVWVKTNPGMGAFYRSQHELLALFRKDGAAHVNNVELGRHGRSRSNVWNYRGVNVFGPDRKWLAEHPTVKPVALVIDALRDASRPGDIVFDPFMGSGTTMIAAERTRRRCFGIEIEPRFVDLAIRRWEEESGHDAVRASDGLSFFEASEVQAVPSDDQPHENEGGDA
ncbi:hypothetical protein ASD50_21170 [Mesorhizobium sp. Root552]|uniref:site-specific DNA-methyltransferase n=1 Tax=Mesorhizobium sp. Root552 TaxID=1736555 RepID=UPI0006F47B39|nr:DNA methyltransferase [Mesorhizobium sp. Root552]KQZ22772.1 hypothetical protein ASD50_21170 [Mesorhizobium sp. Root552]